MRTAILAPSAAVVGLQQPTPTALFADAAAKATYATERLHPGVFALSIASYGASLRCFWMLFVGDAVTFLSLAVCKVYCGMFFGVPLVTYRVATKGTPHSAHGSLASFLRGNLEIDTGLIGGWAALAQVLVIPVCVAFGVLSIGLSFNVAG